MANAAQAEAIAWGYTLHDVDSLAWGAANKVVTGAFSKDEAYDYAWSAISLALVEAVEAPERDDLYKVGRRAIYDEITAQHQTHGLRHGEEGPRFAAYWRGTGTNQFEANLVERLALQQILPTLKQSHRDAIMARALFPDPATAAAAMGITYKAFNQRVANARRSVLALWIEGESPRVPGENECRSGHDREQHGYITNQGKWHCRECHRLRNTRIRHGVHS